MSYVMTAKQLADKATNIAKNYKTLYVMGCFGAPMTAANKERYINNYAYNRKSDRAAMIRAASADTFGFDCVCLIKGILWGWSGDVNAIYGGAKYTANGVPDYSANGMISVCSGVSRDFSYIEIGEAVWMDGHIGIYIGDGLAVECTPKWANKVQITAVGNIGPRTGYNTRTWTKHGKLPWVDYSGQEPVTEEIPVAEDSSASAAGDSSAAPQNDKTVSFSDVPDGAWYHDAVAWAVENGITNGTGNGTFSPNKTLTRAECVTMLYRLWQKMGGE